MFDFLGSLGSGIGKAFDFASNLGSSVWGGIQDLGGSLWDMGKSAIGGLDGLFGGQGGAGAAGGAAGGIAGEVAKQSGFNLGDLGKLAYDWYSRERQMGKMEDLYKKTMQQADAFSPYKPQTAKRLNELLTNPSSISSSPSYNFRLRQGEESTNRALAAKGYRLSGNQLQALNTYGQEFASTEYEAEVERLRKLLGASGAEQVLANLGMTGIQGQQGIDETIGQIIEGLGSMGRRQ